MKTKKNILKAIATAVFAYGAFAGLQAQSNLGAACGCPPVASRPTQLLSAQSGYTAVNGTGGGKLSSMTLTCDKTWILDVKIYVDAGNTLTIEPGTVIKGNPVTNPASATALVIARGGKIIAPGTESCPIVFTGSEDPMDGTYGIENIGKWGGLVVLGRASNNLTLAANGPFVPGGAGRLAVADGLGTVEGFASSYPLDQYGVAQATPTGYITGTAPAIVSPATTAPYTFDLTGTWTSNEAVTGFKRFRIASEVGTFVLNGMTVTQNGFSGVITNVSSASSGLITVTTNTTAGGATTGTTGVLTFTGNYPTPGTQGLYFGQSYPTSTAQAAPYTVLVNPTGPILANGGVNGNSNINYAIPLGDATVGAFDDNDNSGVMTYVSIRHSGAILAVGAEINGLTLASVGRGTTIEHIEIVSCADDNIEVFGGTVNLKYITTLFGNDDMFDYDLGWKGKCQFFFGMKNTQAGKSPDNDNGIEADSHDNNSNTTFRSRPVLYNFTIVGNGKASPTADNRALAGANFKDGAEGELYNSIFANFKNGINIAKSISSPATYNSWNNWRVGSDNAPASSFNSASLKIKCNTIVVNSTTADWRGLGINADNSTAVAVAPTADELAQFTTDGNIISTDPIPGFSYAFTVNSATNVVSVKNDVTPNPALGISGCPTPPVDGFFEPANYRGAFSSVNGDNWLSNWSYSQVLNSTSGVRACATDLNLDGTTDVSDFLIFAPAFNTSCN
jgi:hypothetical protein